MWTEPATCFQCNAPFKEADNTSSSCQHHTRGGGCFFAFVGALTNYRAALSLFLCPALLTVVLPRAKDEFIGVSFTCCNKNEPHAGSFFLPCCAKSLRSLVLMGLILVWILVWILILVLTLVLTVFRSWFWFRSCSWFRSWF